MENITNKKKLTIISHPFEPIYDKNSKILVLGTMASPKSREFGFYYGHPQNNFWSVTAAVLDLCIPRTINEKKDFLLKNNIAVWDVLKSCKISGADDSSIKEPVVHDFTEILLKSDIKAIFTTGMTATKLYKKYCYEKTLMPSIYLPSTSPANRKYFNFDKLVNEYKIIVDYIKSKK